MSEEKAAKILLSIKAVALKPSNPFKWVSGIYAPIYCDNRLLMSYVKERREIIELMAEKVKKEIGLDNFDKIAGIASSGIPPAAWLAEKLDKPMIYIRKSEKDHGKQKLIEGVLEEGEKVLMVEDLVSTGGSSIKGVEAVRENGGVCDYCVVIFTYEMEKAKKGFEEAKCELLALTNFSSLVKVAFDEGFIKKEEMEPAFDFIKNPKEWGKKRGFE